MTALPTTRPVYLQHMPEWVARELDRLYGMVEDGPVTVHLSHGEASKFTYGDNEGADTVQKRWLKEG